ncbi:MAG: orotidine-5'-phosphate decarboxylase [Deltaproteobacteria bacterium]|nr:orotidine-5'-phosphate decarboxylase [Deltaproteobacteria bacterium]
MAIDLGREIPPKGRLAFPLDFPDEESALGFVKTLAGHVGVFKIGLELFTKAGPGIVGRVRDLAPDSGIFLDLKFHDIPTTVGRAVRAAAKLGPDLLTVHAQGGESMLKAAVENAGTAKILAVTLLTSLGPADLPELRPGLDARGYALSLAKRALACSCHGVVASCQELPILRKELGKAPIIAVPGIRPVWAGVKADDQARVGTPTEAMSQGASLLVVGRPIRDAADPVDAAEKTALEMLGT